MERIRIQLPEKFTYSMSLRVRITDLNYGGHVGNDRFLAYAQEARTSFLQTVGYSELSFDTAALIQASAAIEFKKELRSGDSVIISVAAGDFHSFGFNLFYLMELEHEGKKETAAKVVTGMICYDYDLKKPVKITDAAKAKLLSISGNDLF